MTLYKNYNLVDDIDIIIELANDCYSDVAKLLDTIRNQEKLPALIHYLESLTISFPGHNIDDFLYFLHINNRSIRSYLKL